MTAAPRKTSTKKTTAKKTAAKKAPTRKKAVKKTAARKAPGKKAPAKKAVVKKAPKKKTAAKKTAARKAPGKKAPAKKGWNPNIIVFACNWCSYAGADTAGVSRIQHEPHFRMIRVMCSGRIHPGFVLRSFEKGADGVLVSGCHPGDCHYVSGNLLARRRFTVFRELLSFLGLERERLQFSWVSAAEAVKWTEVVDAVTAQIRALGPRGSAWGEALDKHGFKFQVSGRGGSRTAPTKKIGN
ncbi:MAG: hydrogenase iron-sulfur subunit [Candidatus Latescibacteria bacterium]|nr:hydrogenase iron-sulfur subunit [Candidatus Latescibacterota bacterium]